MKPEFLQFQNIKTMSYTESMKVLANSERFHETSIFNKVSTPENLDWIKQMISLEFKYDD